MLFLLVLLGGFAALALVFIAFRGPSASKALKRRMELVKERHGDVIAGNAQAQIRKLMAQRGKPYRRLCVHPDPEACPAAQAAGADRQEHPPRQICA